MLTAGRKTLEQASREAWEAVSKHVSSGKYNVHS